MCLHFTTLRDYNILYWLSFWTCDGPCVLNLRNNVHAFDDVTKHDMLAVQVGRAMLSCDDEKLAAICLYIVNTTLAMCPDNLHSVHYWPLIIGQACRVSK